jgi:hypothetical protein
MEQDNLDLLKQIKKIAVSDAMYPKIMQRIERNKMTILPMYKVVIAASLLLGLITTELYIVQNRANPIAETNKINNIIPINDNSLYNE